MSLLQIERYHPHWAEPLEGHHDFKGARGGRAGGKSHWFAEEAVEAMVNDLDLRIVCIREFQRSLRFSVKSVIEGKIRGWGLEHTTTNPRGLFRIMANEIRSVFGSGVVIFEGMQDHTADSIKSLEGFRIAWVEEAQNLSKRSLDLLLPTIREPGAEIWFSWNPTQPTDPVDNFLIANKPDNAVVVTVNYDDNWHCPERSKKEAARCLQVDPDGYQHIWGGGYDVHSQAQVLHGKWRVDEFTPGQGWDGPYYGLDYGYSQDPAAASRSWIHDSTLYVEHEAWQIGVELDDLADLIKTIPGAEDHNIKADPSRPEISNHLGKPGRDLKVQSARSWPNSVKDGITYLRAFREIVIHTRCRHAIEEARMWKWKVDRLTGEPLSALADGHEHVWDGIRYAHSHLIKESRGSTPWFITG